MLSRLARHRHRVVGVAVGLVVGALVGGPGVRAGPCWTPPVESAVADPFRAPECPWCPGNRGIDFASPPGISVRAVAAGVVTFAGAVAGERYVVVEHADGLRATYGRLATIAMEVGAAVPAGTVVGTTGGGTFYFGLRRGEEYIDPTPFLGRIEARPRLVPVDGTPPRAAPAPRLVCPG